MNEFTAFLKARGRTIERCNCGGPYYGTDHSPDCAQVLSEEALWEEFQEAYRAEVVSLDERR